jgi:hypothetical protein
VNVLQKLWVAALLLSAVALALAGNTSDSDQTLEHQRYCMMVAIHNESGGEFGWPNFREIDCNSGGK